MRGAATSGSPSSRWTGWLTDRLTALGVRAVLVSIAVAGAVWLAGRFGRRWWLVGAPALAAIGVVFIVVQPLVVQPLFNRFEPLPDRALAAEIEALAAGMGVEVDDVLVADASRRTTTANAYIAGLGPTRRVVLYDTLLDGRFSRGEIRFVTAHELAHVEQRHLWKGLAWFTLLAVPGVFGLAWITNRYGGLGPRLVPLGLAFAFAYLLLTEPLANAVSRRYEAEADWLALEATRDPESGDRPRPQFRQDGPRRPRPACVARALVRLPSDPAASGSGWRRPGRANPPRTRCLPARGGSGSPRGSTTSTRSRPSRP